MAVRQSELEAALVGLINRSPYLRRLSYGLVLEHRFAPPRMWRFDLCWPDLMLALEVDGGVWSGGRHLTGSGFERDCEKLNTAAELGWWVLRFPGKFIEDQSALEVIERTVERILEERP